MSDSGRNFCGVKSRTVEGIVEKRPTKLALRITGSLACFNQKVGISRVEVVQNLLGSR